MGTTPAITRLGIPSLNMQDAVPFSSSFSFSFLLSKIQQPQGQFQDLRDESDRTGDVLPCALAGINMESCIGNAVASAAEEFKAKGANTILGPGLNVHRVEEEVVTNTCRVRIH